MTNNEKLVTGDFVDGSSIVIKKEGLTLLKGLIFEDGSVKWLKALYVGDFYCGLAAIDTGNSFGYINRKGEYVIQSSYLCGEDFSDQVALVSDTERIYLIDSRGNVIKKFSDIYNTSPFHQGYALLHEISDDGEYKRDAIINYEGDFIIPFGEEEKIKSPYHLNNPNDFYSDGRIRIVKNHKYGFKDLSSSIIIEPKYRNAYRFSEGLAMVDNGSHCGFIDTHGNEVIPFEFESAESFAEGLAAVKSGNKWGCIDKNCNTVIPFLFDGLGEFNNGEIKFMIGDRCGIMDREMNIIVEPRYDFIKEFKDGIAEFTINDKNGVIDRSGNELISDLLIGSAYYHGFN